MATILFTVPKDPVIYREWVKKVGIVVLRDYKPSSLPFIREGDAVKMQRNNCVCRVVKRHSIAEQHDHYIVIMANNALSFNEIVCDYDPLFDYLCKAGDVERYYSVRKK